MTGSDMSLPALKSFQVQVPAMPEKVLVSGYAHVLESEVEGEGRSESVHVVERVRPLRQHWIQGRFRRLTGAGMCQLEHLVNSAGMLS